jgi:hypothetical protein
MIESNNESKHQEGRLWLEKPISSFSSDFWTAGRLPDVLQGWSRLAKQG